MKLFEGCSHECLVCGALSCDPEDHRNFFARASKEELIERYYSDKYSEEDKQKIKVWLRVQHAYEI